MDTHIYKSNKLKVTLRIFKLKHSAQLNKFGYWADDIEVDLTVYDDKDLDKKKTVSQVLLIKPESITFNGVSFLLPEPTNKPFNLIGQGWGLEIVVK